ncbi:hypothetical protein RMN57_18360 [Kitasatospora sp. CM 4170]|uniref:STAS domain-containing protein n=1 Tax=Kitasatospora aburaviensis TaxID=67265 RepID=A0ABW1F2L1_9ACTN|nr:hypothetical protein [Kitasatospora sp. CM 4170]WNM46527.1 hypothetical protein RMN57_18360 [Kitasatospora sp. CM 4170]
MDTYRETPPAPEPTPARTAPAPAGTPPAPAPEPPREPRLTCDLGALPAAGPGAADLAVVDALARLRLAAARHGVRVVLSNASGPLRELLSFAGLAGVLPVEPDDDPLDAAGDPPRCDPLDAGPGLLGVQPGRQPEEREDRVGVEEVGEPGDPAR